MDDLVEESERKMREEEEGEVEGGVKGERRGLLSRTRENGGARKVSNPLHYCGPPMFSCFCRVTDRRSIKLHL